VNVGHDPGVYPGEGGDRVSSLFQARWRGWVIAALVIAIAIAVVLVIAYSGGSSGGGGY
jgi:hypothetical protein